MLDSVASNFSICVVWLVVCVQVLGLLEASADLLSACMGEAVCIAVLADARSKGAFGSAALWVPAGSGGLPKSSNRPNRPNTNRNK